MKIIGKWRLVWKTAYKRYSQISPMTIKRINSQCLWQKLYDPSQTKFYTVLIICWQINKNLPQVISINLRDTAITKNGWQIPFSRSTPFCLKCPWAQGLSHVRSKYWVRNTHSVKYSPKEITLYRSTGVAVVINIVRCNIISYHTRRRRGQMWWCHFISFIMKCKSLVQAYFGRQEMFLCENSVQDQRSKYDPKTDWQCIGEYRK